MHRLVSLLLLLCCLFAHPATAVYEKQDGFPWNMKLHGHHDAPIARALPEGSFMMNVGPTGIRAQITHEHPTAFTVKFVFPKSPAAGKIVAGDVIVGANGKYMTTPHKFGRRTVSGWHGPMTAMAVLIEDAQGKDGKLELIVWPKGSKKDEKKVEIQIAAVGRFSKTFPFNCERSDKLMIDLCDFLAQEYDREGKFGRPHAHGAAILALMASGENKYAKLIRHIMSGYPKKRYSSENGGGFPTWGWGYDGIVMGEYYLLTKDKSLIPAMESLAVAYRDSVDWRSGGYMHKPFPFITKRIAGGGPKGYGSMSQPGGLAMIAQSIFEVAGVNFDEATYMRTHQGFLNSASPNGAVGYGFKAWDHAVIKLKGESIAHAKEKNKRGVGYHLQTGMEGLKEFDIVWPTKADPRYKPLDWIVDEADRVRSYVTNKNELVLVRDMSLPDPTRPIDHNGRRTPGYGQAGQGAIAHSIGSRTHPEWKYLAQHLGQSCANSADSIFDGHASTLMHTHWGSLGAYFGGQKGFRHYMDGIKWWFVMGQTHDGGFVPMPGRDYASTDHVYATRIMPSAIAALILSVKEAKLQITGADAGNIIPQDGGSDHPDKPALIEKAPAPVLPDIQGAVLGDEFEVKYTSRQVEQLDNGTPYARILGVLDELKTEEGDRGTEAALFAEKLRAYLTVRNNKLIEQALAQPAKTLARSKDHLRRLNGFDDLGTTTVRAMIGTIENDTDIVTLSRYFEQYDSVRGYEAERGASDSTAKRIQQLAQLVQRFIEKPGISGRLAKEAQGLIDEINLQ